MSESTMTSSAGAPREPLDPYQSYAAFIGRPVITWDTWLDATDIEWPIKDIDVELALNWKTCPCGQASSVFPRGESGNPNDMVGYGVAGSVALSVFKDFVKSGQRFGESVLAMQDDQKKGRNLWFRYHRWRAYRRLKSVTRAADIMLWLWTQERANDIAFKEGRKVARPYDFPA